MAVGEMVCSTIARSSGSSRKRKKWGVVLQHEPEDADLAGTPESLLAHVLEDPLLHTVHGLARQIEERRREHVSHDREADEAESLDHLAEPVGRARRDRVHRWNQLSTAWATSPRRARRRMAVS